MAASSRWPPTRWTSPCPRRFGLVYRDKDNTEKTPLCIHRAPLGTHERFIGFLIEHYAGNFPLWLAPEQVRVLTIGEEEPLVNYAKAIVQELRANMVRAEGDYSNDKINGKIQQAEQAKVHTMLVVGPRDLAANAVSVRVHGKGSLGAKPKAEVVAEILARRFASGGRRPPSPMKPSVPDHTAVLVIDVQTGLFCAEPAPFEAEAVVARINAVTGEGPPGRGSGHLHSARRRARG